MQDRNFFRVMAVFQLLIAGCNFYVASTVFRELTLINISIGLLCVAAGVFCTVAAARLAGLID